MGQSGQEFISKYEAEQMIAKFLKEYEKDTVEPRHKETQSDLKDIKEMVQEGRGMMRMAGWIGSAAGLVWIVVQIKQAVGH